MKRTAPFAVALLLDLVGAGVALLAATRHWQTITLVRSAPFPSVTKQVTGRTIDAAPTALALVALAGVVAVLATRGVVRRIVGIVLALAGAALIWRAVGSAGAVSLGRAADLVGGPFTDTGFPLHGHVASHVVWPAVTGVCGVFVTVSGALIAWRGHRWQVMSSRYEAQPAQDDGASKAVATLWSKLDRGEDPTG